MLSFQEAQVPVELMKSKKNDSVFSCQNFLNAFGVSFKLSNDVLPLIVSLKRGFDVKVEDLRSEVRSLEEQFKKQSSELLQQSTKAKLQESQIRTLKRRKQGLSGDPPSQNSQVKQLVEANEALLKKSKDLDADLHEQKELLLMVQEERNGFHEKYLAASKALSDLKSQDELARQTCSDLEVDVKQMRNVIVELESEKHQLQLHLKNEKARYESIDQVRTHLNQNEKILVDQIQDLRLKNELLMTEKNDLKSAKMTAEELHEKVGRARDNLNLQLEQERRRVRELTSTVDEKTSIALNLRSWKAEAERRKEIHEREIERLQTSSDLQKKELERLHSEVKTIEAEKEDLKNLLEQQKETDEHKRSEMKEDLNQRQLELAEECTKMKDRVKRLEKILDEERLKFLDLETRYTEQTISMEEVYRESDGLKQQLTDGSASRSDLENQITELKKQIQEISGASDEKDKVQDEMQSDMRAALENVRVLASKLEIVQNSLDRAEATKKELLAVNKTKDASLDTIHEKHTAAIDENKRLIQEIASMKQKSEELNRLILSYKDTISELERVQYALNEDLKKERAKIEVLVVENEKFSDEKSELASKYTALEERLETQTKLTEEVNEELHKKQNLYLQTNQDFESTKENLESHLQVIAQQNEEYMKLQQECNVYKEKAESDEQKLRENENLTRMLRAQNAKIQDRCNVCEDRLKVMQESQVRLEEKIKSMDATIKEKTENEKGLEKLSQHFEQKLALLHLDYEGNMKEVQRLQKQFRKAVSELESKERKMHQLTAEHQRLHLKCQTKDAEIQNIQWNLRAMETKVQQNRVEMQRLRQDSDVQERRPHDAGRTSLDLLDQNRSEEAKTGEGGELDTFDSFLNRRRQI